MTLLPTINYKLQIHCLTFNHASYIEETMNGFCMQKTKFPFVAIIIDDASTDGEPEIICNYLEEHFDMVHAQHDENDDALFKLAIHKDNSNCHFFVILLKYNYYSRNKSKYPLYKEWYKNVTYIASCEGDDYWTDPLKLQKQVDFLESNPDYTMICNRTKLYSQKKNEFIGENYCYNHDQTVKVKDVIYRSGLFISTCSILFRKDIIINYPDYCIKCAVGDYPLQIMAAMKGKVYYFNDIMSVYRIQNDSSWMSKQKWGSIEPQNINRVDSMINMFKGFATDYPKYKRYFYNKIAHYLTTQSPSKYLNTGTDLDYFKKHYQKEYDSFPLFWKFINKLKVTDIPGLRGYFSVYTKPIFDRFERKGKLY